ncbi:MAG: tRNA (N(6)-L-threonylcarbamoyladenosine(37)-C(2))-methylthiotransferase MtaB [Cellulosilyticaceae bacterium]
MENDVNKKRPKTVSFYTLGCKVNQYDTEAVMENFKENSYSIVEFDEYADVYVVNTCTVTHLSDRKCRQMLRKTKKINADSILVAMGCYAQASGHEIKEKIPEVDIIIGTNQRGKIVEFVEEIKNHHQESIELVDNIMDVEEFEELKISSMGERTRVYLKIQEGCNNYCSYCIIPYVRGKIRSRKLSNIVEEATKLAKAGFKEIVLAGIHVASYGKDLGDITLVDVLKAVHEIDGIERIRLSSIEPVVITDAFIAEIAALPKMCRHFHLSLQSGSDTVLKRMNRKYTCEEYLESTHKLRSIWPDVALTTDIIVGFPGETDEEFEETMEFVRKVGFSDVHIFPFSPRTGTVAAKMKEQIEPMVKEKRVKLLTTLVNIEKEAFIKQHVGQNIEVLFEKFESGKMSGYSSNYLKVEAPSAVNLENTIGVVCADGYEAETLCGHILENV